MEDTESLVIRDIATRQAFGFKKYGVTVADNLLPLRQWLQHAYEESLDHAIYLKRAMQEMDAQKEKDELTVQKVLNGMTLIQIIEEEKKEKAEKVNPPTVGKCEHGKPYDLLCTLCAKFQSVDECIHGIHITVCCPICDASSSAPVLPCSPSSPRTVEDLPNK